MSWLEPCPYPPRPFFLHVRCVQNILPCHILFVLDDILAEVLLHMWCGSSVGMVHVVGWPLVPIFVANFDVLDWWWRPRRYHVGTLHLHGLKCLHHLMVLRRQLCDHLVGALLLCVVYHLNVGQTFCDQSETVVIFHCVVCPMISIGCVATCRFICLCEVYFEFTSCFGLLIKSSPF